MLTLGELSVRDLVVDVTVIRDRGGGDHVVGGDHRHECEAEKERELHHVS